MVSGWVILDKPSGMTSRAAGGKIARMFGIKKFGHLGTLDPMASGVLPVALGEATKMIPYLEGTRNKNGEQEIGEKEYLFSVRWGIRTDTDDITGRVLEQNDSIPSDALIRTTCAKLVGEIEQTPPAYSAVHVNGRRAYELARRGESVEMPARTIKIYELRITNHELSRAEFIVRCSAGTYVRSLAQQIVEQINLKSQISNFKFVCTVDMIRRTRTHMFDIKDAHSLDFLENLYNNDPRAVQKYLRPVDFGLDDIPVLELNENDANGFKNGGFIELAIDESGLRRVYSKDKFIGIGEIESGILKPKRVIKT